MIHHVFKAIGHLMKAPKAAKHAATMTSKTWTHAGVARHSTKFTVKQALKGFKFPKNGWPKKKAANRPPQQNVILTSRVH